MDRPRPGELLRHLQGPRPHAAGAGRRIFHSVEAPARPHLGTGRRGRGRARARRSRTSSASRSSRSQGQTDILTMGLPYICPYNVNSIMNPILVACLGLGYFFNLYRGRPLVREGGVVIMSHPTPWAFNPVHHPSYIDFFEQVLSGDDRPARDRGRSTRTPSPPTRGTSTSTARATPTTASTRFYMWYWCAHALEHLGEVIIVGGDSAAVRRLGFIAGVDARRRPRDGRRRRRAGSVHHPHARAPIAHGGRAVTQTRPHGARRRRGLPPLRGGKPTRPGRRRGPGPPKRHLGVDYDTAWARRYPVRLARAMVLDDITRPLLRAALSPKVIGLEHLDPLERSDDHRRQPRQPPRHGACCSRACPRGCATVRSWPPRPTTSSTATGRRPPWSFVLGAIPMERTKVNRRSADLAAEARRRRLEPDHLPRGRSHARWMGPGVQRRRCLPRQALLGAGRPRAPPRHAGGAREGQLSVPARPDRDPPRGRPRRLRRPRTPAVSPPASSEPSPCSRTRPNPTGGRLGAGRRRAKPRHFAVRRPRRGGVRGPCRAQRERTSILPG